MSQLPPTKLVFACSANACVFRNCINTQPQQVARCNFLASASKTFCDVNAAKHMKVDGRRQRGREDGMRWGDLHGGRGGRRPRGREGGVRWSGRVWRGREAPRIQNDTAVTLQNSIANCSSQPRRTSLPRSTILPRSTSLPIRSSLPRSAEE